MLPWKSILKIDKNIKRAVYLQIADCIVDEILAGRIPKGHKMPGTRGLAEELVINRKTVALAYDELLAQGWIEILPSKGTFIKQSLPVVRHQMLNDLKPKQKGKFIDSIASQPFSIIPEQVRPPNTIDDGIPDFRMAPIDALLKTTRSVSKGRIGRSVLLNSSSYGEIELRKALVEYLSSTRALNGSVDNIIITRGSQMAIYLLFTVLLKKGDKVIVGELNYKNADQIIENIGAELVKVPVDDRGLNIEAIERAASQYNIKAVYISPHHHYPTTVTMPAENRMKLLELSNRYDFAIIEDDYDYDYHYKGSPILPLASLDKTGNVIYIGSFSKILVPSIRIGYVYAHPKVVDEIAKLRRMIDKQGDPIKERALAELIRENEIQRCLKKAVLAYKKRRDIFCSTLHSEIGDQIQFNIPDGGMAIWATFKNGIIIKELVTQAESNGLFLNIDPERTPHSCRFGFASMDEKELEINLGLLIKTVREYS
ncbi:MAG: PLP-dependent aminotransferase family protein [Cyclobacteriaceae bacterium]